MALVSGAAWCRSMCRSGIRSSGVGGHHGSPVARSRRRLDSPPDPEKGDERPSGGLTCRRAGPVGELAGHLRITAVAQMDPELVDWLLLPVATLRASPNEAGGGRCPL